MNSKKRIRLLSVLLTAALLCACVSNAPQASATTAPDPLPQTPSPAVTAAPTPADTEEPTPTVTEEPAAPIRGVYELSDPTPVDEVTGARLELLESGDTLIFRFILIELCGTAPQPVRIAPLQKNGSEFSAVYDDETVYVRLFGTRDGVELEVRNCGVRESISGAYLPIEEPAVELPAIPQTETDPLSPDGRIERHLGDAARSALGLGAEEPLTAQACASVTDLDLFETGITSLQGIEYFTNLKYISISGGYLRDISALASIPSIEQISVSHCPIREIPDFGACEHLEVLQLTDCCIEDLSPVAKLSGLRWLSCNGNRITSVAPLRSLTQLDYVNLSCNPVIDWDSVSDNAALIAALPWDYEKALAVQKRAQMYVDEAVEPGMTDLQKQIALCRKIHEIAEYRVVRRKEEPDGYEVLMKGTGVCGDFAQAASLLMTMAGLHVINCGSDTHEWNMIELDGQWYEFDCLWDDETEPQDWKYFNLSSADMSRIADHRHDPLRYPYAEHTMMTLDFLFS